MTHPILAGLLAVTFASAPDTAARTVIDTAIARMGGAAALRGIERMELDLVTEWQRQTLDARAVAAVSGYERSTELRDYTRPAWRSTRRFFAPGGSIDVVNVVTDSVAIVRNGATWRPQNVAYVDERDELFTFTAERLLVLARDADARMAADTIIDGGRYARVNVTVGRFRPTLHFRRGDGMLALARFRAAQPSDFGLAPWGEMDVAVWYSRWQQVTPAGLVLPTQVDVFRVGRPYKRMTVIAAKVNPAIPADSFAIGDSLRAAYVATARRPMYDLPVDSARIVDGTFASFAAPGTPAGAVKVGGRWLLLESGTAPLSVERSVAFLRQGDAGSPIAGAIVTAGHPGAAGGVPWLAREELATWVAGAAKPYVDAARYGWHVTGAAPTVADDRWIPIGRDSVRVETIDVPDYPATVVVYAPSLRWAYAWPAAPMHMAHVAAHARRRGWTVERIGNARNVAGAPLPRTSAGIVDTFPVISTALHDTLSVVVRLPPGYVKGRRYPVVYTLQPGVYFRRLQLPTWLDSAEAKGATPVIAVAIPDADGLAAFRPDTREGDAYVRFIAEELVPAVEARHAIHAEPAGRLLLGFSAGANVLLDVAVRNPAMFGRMAAVSPGWMFRSDDGGIGVQFDSIAVASIRRAPSAPATNVWFVWGDGPSEWERRSRVLGAGVIAALRARGVPVHDAGLVPGDHGLELARTTLAAAMRYLLAP